MTGEQAAAVVLEAKTVFAWSDADAASALMVSTDALARWRTHPSAVLRHATAGQVERLRAKIERHRRKHVGR